MGVRELPCQSLDVTEQESEGLNDQKHLINGHNRLKLLFVVFTMLREQILLDQLFFPLYFPFSCFLASFFMYIKQFSYQERERERESATAQPDTNMVICSKSDLILTSGKYYIEEKRQETT